MGIQNITFTSNKEIVKKNATNLRYNLDTKAWPTVEETAVAYRQHVKDTLDNPTTGQLARHKFIDSPLKSHSSEYWRNEQIVLNQDAETQQLLKELKNKIDTLYPTTQKARKYIIKSNRVDFDTVKRARGYNWMDKLRIIFSKVK